MDGADAMPSHRPHALRALKALPRYVRARLRFGGGAGASMTALPNCYRWRVSDEPEAGVDGRRQKHRRRLAGAAIAVAPGDTAQIGGVEQERPDVVILAATVRPDLLRDDGFGGARGTRDHGRLTDFDEKGEGRGGFARAERAVHGNGCGMGNGQDSEMAGSRSGHPPGARPRRRTGTGLVLLLLRRVRSVRQVTCRRGTLAVC